MSDVAQTTKSAISKIYAGSLKEGYIPGWPILAGRSIHELESVLHAGEYPEAVLFGLFRIGTTGFQDQGSLWATNERLLFVGFAGVLGRTRVVRDYSYDLLTGVEIRGGSTLSIPSIILRLAGTELQFSFNKEANVDRYAEIVRSKSGFAFGRRQALATDDEDMLSKLERLAALREKGALTEEEFRAAKTSLLGL